MNSSKNDKMVYKNMTDPLASLPKSHEKKYLPRQQTWTQGSMTPQQRQFIPVENISK